MDLYCQDIIRKYFLQKEREIGSCLSDASFYYIKMTFFHFGFNGSGADNDLDAESCIDGQLTSAWNCV